LIVVDVLLHIRRLRHGSNTRQEILRADGNGSRACGGPTHFTVARHDRAALYACHANEHPVGGFPRTGEDDANPCEAGPLTPTGSVEDDGELISADTRDPPEHLAEA